MKFFAVFAAVLAVACASNTWTLQQLAAALENPTTSPSAVPVLEQALNIYMEQAYAGQNVVPTVITTQGGTIGSYTLAQLSQALENPTISPLFKYYLENALNELMEALFSGENLYSISVNVPTLQYSYMSLQELDAAIDNPAYAEVKPYLLHTLNEVMEAMWQGTGVDNVVVMLPLESDAVAPAPGPGAVVGPVAPAPGAVVGPVAPAPGAVVGPAAPAPSAPAPSAPGVEEVGAPGVEEVAAPTPAPSASNPLVQIILNVKQYEETYPVGPIPRPKPVSHMDYPDLTWRN